MLCFSHEKSCEIDAHTGKKWRREVQCTCLHKEGWEVCVCVMCMFMCVWDRAGWGAWIGPTKSFSQLRCLAPVLCQTDRQIASLSYLSPQPQTNFRVSYHPSKSSPAGRVTIHGLSTSVRGKHKKGVEGNHCPKGGEMTSASPVVDPRSRPQNTYPPGSTKANKERGKRSPKNRKTFLNI